MATIVVVYVGPKLAIMIHVSPKYKLSLDEEAVVIIRKEGTSCPYIDSLLIGGRARLI